MSYVVYINGTEVQKKFSKQFINYITDYKIYDDILWEESTRQKLVMLSRFAVDALLKMSRRVYWPNGTLFKCKLIRWKNQNDVIKRNCVVVHKYHRHIPKNYYNYKKNKSNQTMNHTSKCSNVTTDKKLGETEEKLSDTNSDSWYKDMSFMDLEEGEVIE
ncbi:LEF-6 [Urbanus proteus nucleopolyhedrovirus]|uniref:LEF-6 n=1 Tax=Urbanus proteus nucleopolyhedrovirus TaxID=1675866 RepID=A0A162GTP3_9ABAC|nr:LEF-6 [Urbanus proteus nucleopolyhedrovirus]AKR17286.1 LEF-6 [Urbanus proteus nucleopolyhedrovirus]